MNHASPAPAKTLSPIKRGVAILVVFMASLTITRHASAIDFTAIAINFVKSLGLEALFGQVTSNETNSLTVTSNQTALSSALLSNAISKNSQVQASIEQGIAVGEKIVEAQHEKQIGRGLPASIGCEAVAEKQLANTRKIITDEVVVRQGSEIASKHFVSETEKRAARTADHLQGYCDVSEAAQGICILQADGMGGADTNYGTWASSLSLSKEQQKAAQNYIFNTIDPANTVDSKCEGSLCDQLSSAERGYNALASVVHNAYLGQIADRSIMDVVPDAKAAVSEVIKADNPAAKGNTVLMTGNTTTKASSAASITASSTKTK